MPNQLHCKVNFPPTITGGSSEIEITVGKMTSYSFSVEDTDDITVTVTGPQLTNKASLTENEGTWTYSFIWTHEDDLNFTLRFAATDTFNSSSVLEPKV